MTGIVEDILEDVDDILGIRDDLGAKKDNVYILTRTWTGQIGRGSAVDVAVQMLPTPYVKDYSHSLKLSNNGSIKQGDLLIRMISKKTYTAETDIDLSVANPDTTEKFYYINGRLYNMINIVESYVTWNVLVRKASKQTLYLA